MSDSHFLTLTVTLFGVSLWYAGVAAKVCLFGQEPNTDQRGKLRWVLPLERQDLCSCSEIRPGGVNMVVPKRAFQPYYTDHPIFTDDQEIIDDYFKCHGDRFSDCMDFLSGGFSRSGVFKIYPQQYPSGLEVYCDMTSANGGWIVFQRRYSGSVNFHRNWTEYKQGFGTLTGEFWLGNDILRRLTAGDGGIKWTLRVDVVNEHGSEDFLMKSPFRVIGEEYTLNVGDSGSAPNVKNICGQPLGMEDGSIPDNRITASDSYLNKRPNASGNCMPSNGRLNKPGTDRVVGGWCAKTKSPYESKWFQVDLGERLQVEGVILQGIIDPLNEWPARVESYQVQYRDGQNSSWLYVVETSPRPKTFPGSTDQTTPVTSMFDQPIQARYIRIKPITHSFWISMRMELIGCKVKNICGQPLGMEDGSIPDNRITASDSYLNKRPNASGNCMPSNGRLNKPGTDRVVGGWCAKTKSPYESKWFQVDLGERLQVEGVILQGIIDPLNEWPARVESYQVQYRDGQNSSWLYVVETSPRPKTFLGSTDQTTPVTSMFDQPIQARYIRIKPITHSFWISMRMELIGCKGDVLEWANNQTFFINDSDGGLGNCANDGGWWFRHGLSCVQSNLNSKYIEGSMKRGSWEGSRIVKSEMKIRPNIIYP